MTSVFQETSCKLIGRDISAWGLNNCVHARVLAVKHK